MRNIRVEKLVINICVGESGDAVSKAARVLEQISGQEPVYGKGRFFSYLNVLIFQPVSPSVLSPSAVTRRSLCMSPFVVRRLSRFWSAV